jgi:two-component system response regulator WspF
MRVGLVTKRRRDALVALVRADSDAERAWILDSVDEAVARAREQAVDAILVDAETLKGSAGRIASIEAPVAVLRTKGASDAAEVYDAMSAGAALAVELADGIDDDERRRLMGRVRRTCRVIPSRRPPTEAPPRVVAIGSSTGGPSALRAVLGALGPIDRVAIAIVQHLEPEYVPGLAGWLTHETGIPVDLSADRDALVAGRAVIASTLDHLVVEPDGRLVHRRRAVGDIHHPSVDALFHSLAGGSRRGVAVLLTGMGRDGAAGLLELRKNGWATIAQDEASSSVYGMPRAAKELEAADQILPITKIGRAIAFALEGSK